MSRYKDVTDIHELVDVAISFIEMPINLTPYSPMIIDHPVFENGIVTIDGESIINITESDKNLNRYRTYYKNLILNRAKTNDAFGIFMLIRKSYRLTFYKYVYKYLSTIDKAHLLSEVYIGSENPNIDVNVTTKQLIMWFKKANKKELMGSNDYKIYSELPDLVTCYRGVGTKSNPNGISYTLNLDKAKWFAQRFGDGNGYVITKQVPKKYILAYFSNRNEEEVIVDVVGLDRQRGM